jgi:hypothetical protein
MKTKSRLVQKFQLKLTKQLNVKRNFRYLNSLNLEKFRDKNLKDLDLRKDGPKRETKKDYLIEFNSEMDWEESVLKSPIPVVVKFYAE